jgi:hypothetical protein
MDRSISLTNAFREVMKVTLVWMKKQGMINFIHFLQKLTLISFLDALNLYICLVHR